MRAASPASTPGSAARTSAGRVVDVDQPAIEAAGQVGAADPRLQRQPGILACELARPFAFGKPLSRPREPPVSPMADMGEVADEPVQHLRPRVIRVPAEVVLDAAVRGRRRQLVQLARGDVDVDPELVDLGHAVGGDPPVLPVHAHHEAVEDVPPGV